MIDNSLDDAMSGFAELTTKLQRAENNLIKEANKKIYQKSVKHLCDVIVSKIKTVQDSLDSGHEVALLLASFGQSVLMSIESIQAIEPNCLIFISQLNILINVVKIETERPAHRIGF